MSGRHALLGAAGRRLEHHLVGLLVGDAPPEQLGPPVGDRTGVGGVDADALPAESHGLRVYPDPAELDALSSGARR